MVHEVRLLFCGICAFVPGAAREALEETNASVKIDSLLAVLSVPVVDQVCAFVRVVVLA